MECEATFELGECIFKCGLRNGHDNPYNEIGGTQTKPYHRSITNNFSDDIPALEISWRTKEPYGG